MLKNKRLLQTQLNSNNNYLLKIIEKTIKHNASSTVLTLPQDIPNDLDSFYDGFEKFVHDETGQTINQLASYQQEAWTDRFIYLYRLYIKSQKIGLSTLFLLEDIHHALTDCMGKQIMIIGQTVEQAKLHLSDFIRLVKGSEYSGYLIEKPVPWLKKWQVTKATMAYMHNPKNPKIPTEIYALGLSPTALLSFKRVGHIHLSDPTISEKTIEKLDEAIAAATSRTAITRGSVVIETPPRGPEGLIYSITERDEHNKKNGYVASKGTKRKTFKELSDIPRKQQEDYKVRFYDFMYGIRANIISMPYIEAKKKELGPLFSMFFEAKFFSGAYTWYLEDMINYSENATEFFNI